MRLHVVVYKKYKLFHLFPGEEIFRLPFYGKFQSNSISISTLSHISYSDFSTSDMQL